MNLRGSRRDKWSNLQPLGSLSVTRRAVLKQSWWQCSSINCETMQDDAYMISLYDREYIMNIHIYILYYMNIIFWYSNPTCQWSLLNEYSSPAKSFAFPLALHVPTLAHERGFNPYSCHSLGLLNAPGAALHVLRWHQFMAPIDSSIEFWGLGCQWWRSQWKNGGLSPNRIPIGYMILKVACGRPHGYKTVLRDGYSPPLSGDEQHGHEMNKICLWPHLITMWGDFFDSFVDRLTWVKSQQWDASYHNDQSTPQSRLKMWRTHTHKGSIQSIRTVKRTHRQFTGEMNSVSSRHVPRAMLRKGRCFVESVELRGGVAVNHRGEKSLIRSAAD